VALRREIVNFGRLDLLHNPDEIGGVRQVAVMQRKLLVFDMRVLVDVFDPPGVEGGRPPLHAVNFIALVEQQLCQIGPVLPGHTRDQRAFPLVIVSHAYSDFAAVANA